MANPSELDMQPITFHKLLDSKPPEGISRLSFIANLWPVLLVYIVGPIGDLVSGGGWIAEPRYLVLLIVNLILYVVLFVCASLWAYQPLALVMKRWSPGLVSHSQLIEKSVSDLPNKVGKSFLLAGAVFATYLVIILYVLDSCQNSSDANAAADSHSIGSSISLLDWLQQHWV